MSRAHRCVSVSRILALPQHPRSNSVRNYHYPLDSSRSIPSNALVIAELPRPVNHRRHYASDASDPSKPQNAPHLDPVPEDESVSRGPPSKRRGRSSAVEEDLAIERSGRWNVFTELDESSPASHQQTALKSSLFPARSGRAAEKAASAGRLASGGDGGGSGGASGGTGGSNDGPGSNRERAMRLLANRVVRPEDIEGFDAFPYPLSDLTKKSLRLALQVQMLNMGTAPADSALHVPAKSIVLASPHPGSTYFLDAMVKATAKDLGASVLSLDFLDFIEIMQELDRMMDSPASASGFIPTRGSSKNSLHLSRSFTPSQYQLWNDADEDYDDEVDGYDEHDESEDDEDFEEDENSPPPSVRNFFSNQRSSSRPVFNVFVNNQDPRNSNSRFDTSKSDGLSLGPKPPFPMMQVVPALAPGSQPDDRPLETIYNRALSVAQVQHIQAQLSDFIRNFSAPTDSAEHRPLFVHLRDATDILENNPETGRRILSALLDSIQSSRKAFQAPVALVMSCSPTLMDSTNTTRDDEFYRKLFDPKTTLKVSQTQPQIIFPIPNVIGNAQHSHTEIIESSSLWYKGTLFQTPLDHMKVEIEKIEVPPPHATPPIPPNGVLSKNRREMDMRYNEWNDLLSWDLKLRVRELNWRNVRLCASSYGLNCPANLGEEIHETLVQARSSIGSIVTKENNMQSEDVPSMLPDDLPINMPSLTFLPLTLSGLNTLENAMSSTVWPVEKVERLVMDAVGSCIDQQRKNSTSQKQTKFAPSAETIKGLTFEHFLDALLLHQNAQQMRFPVEKLDGDTLGSKDGDGGRGSDGGNLQSSSSTHSKTTLESTVRPQERSGGRSGEEDEDVKHEKMSREDEASKMMGQLKKLLSQRGHKLNQYEKKLLSTVVHPNAIHVEFSDLVLSPPTKLLLQTLVTLPLLRPEFFSTGILKRHSIHGVLLFGPPGTGKTMLGKAVAKSGGARFMSIALSDVFDKYVGEGEKNVRAVFTLARKLSPCVVFMDEVDAIFGSRRSDGWHSSRREIINEFMSEWDGLNSNNEGVIIMGATNRPFDLDDAILRRMPRRVMIDLPNEEARRKIMTLQLKDETLDDSVSLDELAKRSANYSGSDLKNLCVAAALTSVKESVVRDTIGDEAANISREDILKRIEGIDDWTQFVAGASAGGARTSEKSRVLVKEHFDVAFKEVPPSLTDQTQTLLELRKWDDLYGEGAAKKKGAKKGWGFALGAAQEINAPRETFS